MDSLIMVSNIRPAILLVVVFVLLTGLLFPLAVLAVGQTLFPHQANGSLVRQNGKVVGSELIGQSFAGPGWFHPRPSAAGAGYDAGNSSGTNLGPLSSKLVNGIEDDPSTEADESYQGVKQLAEQYRKMNGLAQDATLPSDAVTRSASGLDPHISVANAMLQAPRVARERGVPLESVLAQVRAATARPFLGVFGEPAVNVLELNRSLDQERSP